MSADASVRLAGLALRNPVMTASGTFGSTRWMCRPTSTRGTTKRASRNAANRPLSGRNMTTQPRIFGRMVSGSRKIANSASDEPTAQATPAVISIATDISP